MYKKSSIETAKRVLAVTTSLTLASLALAPTATYAQEADAAVLDETSDGGLDEIVVTARKREENAQETPIAVTAMSGSMIEDRQIANVAQVASYAPNVNIQPVGNISGSSATLTAFIRGVGQTDYNITVDPGVGIYVDGVYVARSIGGLLEMADIANVQILRGPQGTLFGKNTIGGAILVNTNEPGNDFELKLEAATGRFNRADFKGIVNVPISDTLAMRAVASYETRDGYQRRLLDGGRQGNKDSFSGRVAFKWEPTDNFKALLAADVNIRREEMAANYLIENRDSPDLLQFQTINGRVVSIPSAPFAYNKLREGAGQCGAPGQLAPTDNPICYSSRWVTGNIDETWAGGPNRSNFDLWGTNLSLEYDFGNVTLKSISAYRDQKSTVDMDLDVSPIDMVGFSSNVRIWQASQELQLTGKILDDKLQFTMGAYYLKEKGKDIQPLRFGFAEFLSGGLVDNDSYAGYLQFSYKVTDRLSITPGIRYTDETKRYDPSLSVITRDFTAGIPGLPYPDGVFIQFSRCLVGQNVPQLIVGGPFDGFPDPTCVASATNPGGNHTVPAFEVSVHSKEWTPALSVNYQFTDNIMGYASYSKGFKNGGFTQRTFAEQFTPSFKPEFVTSYEVGLKTELFDRRLRMNVAVFQSDYNEMQIVVNEGIAPKVRNGGEGRIKGFEIEGQAAPADWLRIDYGVGYLDAFYRSIDPDAFPVNLNSKFSFVPEWTATLAANATVHESEMGKFVLRGDWYHQSGAFKDAVNDPRLYQPAYSVFGASASFTDASDHFTVTAGVTNLSDKRYIQGGFVQLDSSGVAQATYSRPREWFLKVAYKY
ncbi:TonB-dependent receptor [Croceicoccus naphthovorans]|uniref:TonB-dependent receptor n=1 Tax=Croceicoccus naphthovorans TaxID=1348774 RepID=A0A0G3XLL0_9SPHN|nr:TonB-dependent receptor [Croceicoccus naphthovorans]AKM12072.1 TonB-dependent receptor [Croceicoccus naphthovorans]MBB3992064.1 iron complex outermembrane receptor protein [Croceicoccus naphthovorans]